MSPISILSKSDETLYNLAIRGHILKHNSFFVSIKPLEEK